MNFCSSQPDMHLPESILLERFRGRILAPFTHLVQCLGTLESHGALLGLAECSSTRKDEPEGKVLFYKCSNILTWPLQLSVLILCLSLWWWLLLLCITNDSSCSALFISLCGRLNLATHSLWFSPLRYGVYFLFPWLWAGFCDLLYQ